MVQVNDGSGVVNDYGIKMKSIGKTANDGKLVLIRIRSSGAGWSAGFGIGIGSCGWSLLIWGLRVSSFRIFARLGRAWWNTQVEHID